MKMNNKILAGAAVGLVAGAAIGVLLAPDKGSETRRKILGRKKKMLDRIKDKIRKEQEKMNLAEEKIRVLMQKHLSCSAVEEKSNADVDAQ